MKMVRNALILALVGLFLFGTALAEPVDAAATTITINGAGTVYQQPEQANVMLGVQENAGTVVDAQSVVNEKIAAVTQALIDAGIPRENISVGYLSIYSNYDYNTSPATIVGYSAQHQLVVKVEDIDRAGEVIDIALKAGANQLDGINFFMKDNTTAYKQALGLAVSDATDKAEAVAEAYGKKLGRLVSMTESMNYGYGSYESGLYARAEAADDAGTTQILTGDLSIAASISATYELVD